MKNIEQVMDMVNANSERSNLKVKKLRRKRFSDREKMEISWAVAITSIAIAIGTILQNI